MFKKWLTFELLVVLCAIVSTCVTSCKDSTNADIDSSSSADKEIKAPNTKKPLTNEFKKYWYAGNAEITSYELEQVRYGEVRDGKAVLIYVTEPFLKEKQVKADAQNPDNIPVLKLNTTKKYLTGIYPYSIMTSTFYPVHNNQHALKVSFSAQEWCGHVYAQLNNKDKFEIRSHSYFESEADQSLNLDKTVLENEIWNMIRINPDDLPKGDLEIIPSLEYVRLSHKELKAYKAKATLTTESNINSYEITYPELERTLTIHFSADFPYTIEGWSDSFKGGYGPNAQILTSKAKKIKSIKTPYWQQNHNKDIYLRDSLGL
ncbi:septum formation inhibitor Maf [Maribacter sp. MMG018]|uniref:septum formation inhibitor Maf n=1 Tax=Maribacter sp. MMG018 TaxID=2822688 RepID=UPI001B375E01|nr:septum formation inhibitor Maf [Maribacter sp. MMG018]MBQ4915247.1 septum formation inhibitor Maf [Maribacter sp. MMG018]